LTRFTFGAIHPLNIESLTLAEVSEYLSALRRFESEQHQRG
jgi:hypothetical protein